MRFKDLDKKDKIQVVGIICDDLIVVTLISTIMGIVFLFTDFFYISIFNLLITLGIVYVIYKRYSIFIEQLNKYDYGKINGKDVYYKKEGYTKKESVHRFYRKVMVFADKDENEVTILPSIIYWDKYDKKTKRDNIIDEILENES